jgi:hypothetical protein
MAPDFLNTNPNMAITVSAALGSPENPFKEAFLGKEEGLKLVILLQLCLFSLSCSFVLSADYVQ